MQKMGSVVARPYCGGREARRYRTPPLQLLLPLMLALLLSNARAQQTEQLRRSGATDSASASCCSGGSCDNGSRERVQLSRVVSALRESEARTAQLLLDLTATLVAVARSNELAAGAARNACQAHAFELRGSADAADRLATRASHDFRIAADELAALRRQADGANERLRTQDAKLRALERALIETRLELNASIKNVATVQSEATRNVYSLSGFVGSALSSVNERLNASTDRMIELSKVANQQEFAISQLQQKLYDTETSWKHQVSTLNSELNSTKRDMTSNLSSFSDALVCALNRSNERINASENHISDLFKIADHQNTAIDSLNRTQQQSDISWKHQALALSSELNSTNLVLERLRDELEHLREDHERMIVDAQSTSALLRGCPSGWQRNGSWCYFLVDFGSTWSDSRGRCKLLNADLVTIVSPDVNAFLSTYMSNSDTSTAWLGATDQEEERFWKWITGDVFYIFTIGMPTLTNYHSFARGQPDNNYNNRRDPENCLAMDRGGSWFDMRCNQMYPFFCRIYRP